MNNIQFIAHRGLSISAPENTLSSFRLACDAGIWGVECDIFQSGDGNFIITHDKNLERMCGVNLDVTSVSISEIKKYPVNSGNNIHLYPHERTPVLEEYLSLLFDYPDVHPVIEIKDCTLSYDAGIKFLQIIDTYYSRKDVWVISESLNILQLLRMLDDTIHLQLVMTRFQDVTILDLVENDIGVDIHYKYLTKYMVDALHQQSVEVNTWTVDISEVAEMLIYEYGVDYITSNCPTSLLEI